MNIPFKGACQYGPRLLLPMLPFAMMGLPGLVDWIRTRKWAVPAAYALYVVAAWSVLVNAMGSLVDTMYCETYMFAFPVYLRMPLGPELDNYPLALVCLILAVLLGGWPAARSLAEAPARIA